MRAARACGELGTLGQLLQQDGGRAHRHRPREDRDEPRHTEQVPAQCEHAGSGGHLCRAEPKTSRRIASMRGRENSSPSVNSRNATPSSPAVASRPNPTARQRVRSEHQTDHEISNARRQRQAPRDRHEQHGTASRIRAWESGANIEAQLRPRRERTQRPARAGDAGRYAGPALRS